MGTLPGREIYTVAFFSRYSVIDTIYGVLYVGLFYFLDYGYLAPHLVVAWFLLCAVPVCHSKCYGNGHAYKSICVHLSPHRVKEKKGHRHMFGAFIFL